MAIKDIFKINRKTFFNPSAWLDIGNLSFISKGIWAIVKPLFVAPADPAHQETFEEAIARLNLTEDDIKEREKHYLLFTYLFLILAVAVFGYSFYLILYFKTFLGFCLGLTVVTLLLSQAFRFHFWFFQTKYRKLGCTVQEWWDGKINTTQGPTV